VSDDVNALIKKAVALDIDVGALLRGATDVPPITEEEEKEAKKLLGLMAQAQKLGIDPKLIRAVEVEELGVYRAKQKAQQEAADEERAQADYSLGAAEDTAFENVGQFVSDVNTTVGKGLSFLADVGTVMPRMGGTAIAKATGLMDENAPVPSVAELFGSDINTRGFQSQEGIVRAAAQGVGDALMLGVGMAPVSRVAGATSSVLADMAGLGMSTEAGVAGALGRGGVMAADDMAAVTRQGLDNQVSVDNLTQLDLTNKEQVGYWANKVNSDRAIEGNINVLEDAEVMANKKVAWEETQKKAEKKIAEAEEAGDKKKVKRLQKKLAKEETKFLDEYAPPQAEDTLISSLRTIEEMAERFGEKPADIAKAISRAGGIDPPPSLENLAIRHKDNMKKLADSTAKSGLPNWFERVARPTSRVVSKYVGTRAGSQFEKAFESAARNNEKMFAKYAQDTAGSTAVREWAERNDVKAAFLNLRFTGKEGLNEIMRMADKSLDPAGRATFARLLKDTYDYNKRASRLYKKEALKDEVYWASAIKGDKPEVDARALYGDAGGAPKTIGGAQERKRGLIKPDDETLSQYENPFIAQLNRISGDENLLQLSEKFNLRPSVGVRDNTDDFFKAAQDQFKGQMSQTQMDNLTGLMKATVEGSRKSPNLPIRLFMKQSYAGTLGQFDSALLNLHDISVSAWHNGAMPTGKAFVQRLMQDGEFSLRELGMTNDATSLEEFRAGFDGAVSKHGRLENLVDAYSEKAFSWSGFQTMDRFGKSVTLQAAKNAMEASAKKGTLAKDFGYLLDPKDLGTISRALKAGKRLDEMTPAQQNVMEEAMFARLGEQQLISMAGRPLAYLQNPNLRPFWAMSGFAIKQADLLWEKVGVEVAKGNLGKAGAAAAGYVAWVAAGYGLMDSVRKVPSNLITGDERTEFNAENFLARSGSQIASVASFNKLGDTYSLNELSRDPVGFAFSSLEPAGGAFSNFAQDLSAAAAGRDVKGKFLKSVPLVGDPLYDIWNSR